jgi:hypothetical protein
MKRCALVIRRLRWCGKACVGDGRVGEVLHPRVLQQSYQVCVIMRRVAVHSATIYGSQVAASRLTQGLRTFVTIVMSHKAIAVF